MSAMEAAALAGHLPGPRVYWIQGTDDGFGYTDDGDPPEGVEIVEYDEWTTRLEAADKAAHEAMLTARQAAFDAREAADTDDG